MTLSRYIAECLATLASLVHQARVENPALDWIDAGSDNIGEAKRELTMGEVLDIMRHDSHLLAQPLSEVRVESLRDDLAHGEWSVTPLDIMRSVIDDEADAAMMEEISERQDAEGGDGHGAPSRYGDGIAYSAAQDSRFES
jgi:hypothetical protein